jgi:hypothetical protein
LSSIKANVDLRHVQGQPPKVHLLWTKTFSKAHTQV